MIDRLPKFLALLLVGLLSVSTAACSSDDDYPLAEAQQEWFQFVNIAHGWACECGNQDPAEQQQCRELNTFSDQEQQAIQQCMTDLFQEFRDLHDAHGNRGDYHFSESSNLDYYYCILEGAFGSQDSDIGTSQFCLQSADLYQMTPADDGDLFADIDNLPDALKDYLDCNTELMKRKHECAKDALDGASSQCSIPVGEALDECVDEADQASGICDDKFELSRDYEAIRAFVSWSPYVDECGGYFPSPGTMRPDDDPPTNNGDPPTNNGEPNQCQPDDWTPGDPLVPEPMRTIALSYESEIEQRFRFDEHVGCRCFFEERGFDDSDKCLASLDIVDSDEWINFRPCLECEFHGETAQDNEHYSKSWGLISCRNYYFDDHSSCVDSAMASYVLDDGDCPAGLKVDLQACRDQWEMDIDQCLDGLDIREFRDEQWERLANSCPIEQFTPDGDAPEEPEDPDDNSEQGFHDICDGNDPICTWKRFKDGYISAMSAYYQYLLEVSCHCGEFCSPGMFIPDPEEYYARRPTETTECVREAGIAFSTEGWGDNPNLTLWFECRHIAYEGYATCTGDEYPPMDDPNSCAVRESAFAGCREVLWADLGNCLNSEVGNDAREDIWDYLHHNCDFGDTEFPPRFRESFFYTESPEDWPYVAD